MPIPFTFTCPHCAHPQTVPADQKPQYLGNPIQCPHCQNYFPVTDSASTSNHADASIEFGIFSVSTFILAFILIFFAPEFTLLSLLASVLTGILAIIYAILDLIKNRTSPTHSKRTTFIGLTLGILCSSIGTTILLYSVNKGLELHERVHCASNMRQLGQSLLLYANDHQGHYPDSLATLQKTQDIPEFVFRCSSSDAPSLYVGQSLTTQSTSNCILLYEPLTCHTDGINVLFLDGHVDFIRIPKAEKLIADLQAGLNPPPP